GNANSYSGKTIKFGAVLSITGAGGAYGPQSRDGAKLAVKEINASGGVNGAQIELTVEDDASDKAQSQQKAQTLITSNNVLAFLGPTLSNSAVAVHPLAESLKTPVLAVSTTGIHIVPDCKFPETTPCKYVSRDSLGEETAIPANIKAYARNQGWQGQFLGGNGFNTATVSKQAGAAGTGARSASAWYIGNEFASNKDFVTAYKNEYSKDPDQFAAQGYTGLKILADAAKRANLTFTDTAGDRDKLRAAIETVNIQS